MSRVQVFLHVTLGWKLGMDHDPGPGTLDSGGWLGWRGITGSSDERLRPEPGEVQTLAGPDQSERRQGHRGAASGTCWLIQQMSMMMSVK